MTVKSSPADSPFVRDRVGGASSYVYWGSGHEESLLVVLEAHRRLQEETGDSRTAAALTLAFATHFARGD